MATSPGGLASPPLHCEKRRGGNGHEGGVEAQRSSRKNSRLRAIDKVKPPQKAKGPLHLSHPEKNVEPRQEQGGLRIGKNPTICCKTSTYSRGDKKGQGKEKRKEEKKKKSLWFLKTTVGPGATGGDPMKRAQTKKLKERSGQKKGVGKT